MSSEPRAYAHAQDTYRARCDAAESDVIAAARRAYLDGGLDGRTRLGRAVASLLDIESDHPAAARITFVGSDVLDDGAE